MDAMNVFIVADEDEWDPMRVLERFLTELGHEVACFTAAEAPDDFTSYDAGFAYVHQTLCQRLEQSLVRYVRQGGRLIALHHALASAKMHNPTWLELAGLHIAPPDADCYAWRVVPGVTHYLVNLRPDHYITSNKVQYDHHIEYTSSDAPSLPGRFPALSLPDTEVFLNQHFTDGRARTVLFGSRCADPETGRTSMQDRGGWIRRGGDGLLIYLQPGHTGNDFRHAGFRQILSNCLTWNGRD